MGKLLTEIAQELKGNGKKVQLIYAFNGTGKTRLSREFKQLIAPKRFVDTEEDTSIETEPTRSKILYYNAFTEDLFYWDNDLKDDAEPKLKIQPNIFTDWILQEHGKEGDIITNFQRYTDEKLTPYFNEEYIQKNPNGDDVAIKTNSEITFSFERGNDEQSGKVKISKGEESNFIWCVFYSLLEQVIEERNIPEKEDRTTNQFDELEYIFIDDPVSSLDENHLIELAVDLAQLIKNSESKIKFILTTHNPLFYNVLHNELGKAEKYLLRKLDDNTYELNTQSNDSPFSYHLYLKTELEQAIRDNQLQKYHFNFLRNILEKTSTFLGYEKWGELLPQNNDGRPNPYESRIINISSHSKHTAEEINELTNNDKRVLGYLVQQLNETYRFK